jgi:Protein of unknown function (DUF2971)
MSNKGIPNELQTVIDEFNRLSDEHATSEQQTGITINEPLYHYTDGRGLKGIVESEAIWFTDYRHLNDPSELIHGIGIAKDVCRILENGADERVGLFLQMLMEMFSHKKLSNFECFIASFSLERNDLGQWRSYSDNGRGYALGLAPRIFKIHDQDDRRPDENVFVAPVLYKTDEAYARYQKAIERATNTVLRAVNANAHLVQDRTIGIPFFEQIATEVMAWPLIWYSLTSKHPAYEHEREVRLIILGHYDKLKPFIKTRLRGNEIVPYIERPLPVRSSIVEIIAGPAAPLDAERTVRTLLNSTRVDANVSIGRSDIPYRPL